MTPKHAYLEGRLSTVLGNEQYRDATPEELVEIVIGSNRQFRFWEFDRRKLLDEIRERRGAQPPEDPWWTPTRRKQVEGYREGVRWLRRSSARPVSLLAVSKRDGVPHRDTLADWIRVGKLEKPEDVSER